MSQALRLRPLYVCDQELSLDLESFNFNDLEAGVQSQIFANRPSRDEADSESGFNGGFDGFGGIKFHHDTHRTALGALPFKRHLNHSARAGAALAHEQRGGA